MKVLIIDDSLVHRKILRNALIFLGFKEIEESSNGKEALSQLEGIDLIFLDWIMPVMNGMEFTKVLRENDKKTPIIMISSFGADDEIEQAKTAGVNDYIVKPFSKDGLKQTLKKYMPESWKDQLEQIRACFEEKRKNIRFPYGLFILHRPLEAPTFYKSCSQDISLGGVKIESPFSYKKGQKVEIKINFPENLFEAFSGQGIVCWCQPSLEKMNQFEVGFSFENLSEEQSQRIMQLLQTEGDLKSEKE